MGRVGRICRIGPLFILLSASACSGSLFKVKSPSTLSPLSAKAPGVDLGSVSFRAAPLLTDEETQELFESNLQLAGLLPIRVEVLHNSGAPIDLHKLQFRLRDASGLEWKRISLKKAIARILKANEVYAYNPNSRKTFEREFRAYDLDLSSPLSHAEQQRRGLIIFLSPKKDPVASPRGLILTIDGLGQPATINLN